MPILFSFRHAIELAIKAVLIHAGTREEEVFKRGHNLLEQLPDLQKIALRRGSPLTASLENMVRCWNVDRKGEPMQLANEMRFQLHPFVEASTVVLEELYGILRAQESDDYASMLDQGGIR